ncbi:hypothetical protein FGG78_27180 [Thioclava sp. BHET1]|nr:hypothetical protein FGG78_27180 [Thioclava sp. BHET1]
MAVARIAGAGASARKYDLLTALGALGLAGSKHDQRQVLRLVTLVTARYNWAQDSLSVGQREIARLWAVDERTVKREMAKLRELGWLVLRKQGVRGRVTEYGLGYEAILEATRPHWAAVGPDLEFRLSQTLNPEAVPAGTNGEAAGARVIPFPGQPSPVLGTDLWSRVCEEFRKEAPGLYEAWLRPLVKADANPPDELILLAPSRFHANYVQTHLGQGLYSRCHEKDPQIRRLRVEAGV